MSVPMQLASIHPRPNTALRGFPATLACRRRIAVHRPGCTTILTSPPGLALTAASASLTRSSG